MTSGDRLQVDNEQFGRFKIANVRLRPYHYKHRIYAGQFRRILHSYYWNFFASAMTCGTCDRSLSVAFRAQLCWHYPPPIAGVRWYKIRAL